MREGEREGGGGGAATGDLLNIKFCLGGFATSFQLQSLVSVVCVEVRLSHR